MADQVKSEIGVGIIGCGAISRSMYVPAARALGPRGVRLVAVADTVPDKVREMAAATGAEAYVDYHQVLGDPAVTAVVVATTIGTHFPIALDAIRAGKHVLLQKPMATSVAEADRLIAAARDMGVLLQVEPPHRMNPLVERARRDMDRGLIGKLCLITARAAHNGPHDRPWFYFKEHGGSVIFDMGVHALTHAVALGGGVKRVSATYTTSVPERVISGQRIRADIEDNAVITLEYASGALGSVITNYCTVASLAPSYELFGSEGTIALNAPEGAYLRFSAGGTLQRPGFEHEDLGWFVATLTSAHTARPLLPSFATPDPANPRTSSLAHLVQCLRDGTRPEPSAEFARHVLDIMVTAAGASATGQTQALTTSLDAEGQA